MLSQGLLEWNENHLQKILRLMNDRCNDLDQRYHQFEVQTSYRHLDFGAVGLVVVSPHYIEVVECDVGDEVVADAAIGAAALEFAVEILEVDIQDTQIDSLDHESYLVDVAG